MTPLGLDAGILVSGSNRQFFAQWVSAYRRRTSDHTHDVQKPVPGIGRRKTLEKAERQRLVQGAWREKSVPRIEITTPSRNHRRTFEAPRESLSVDQFGGAPGLSPRTYRRLIIERLHFGLAPLVTEIVAESLIVRSTGGPPDNLVPSSLCCIVLISPDWDSSG